MGGPLGWISSAKLWRAPHIGEPELRCQRHGAGEALTLSLDLRRISIVMPPGDPTLQDATDTELIARWQRGDERAATSLVERHATAVGRYVSSLGLRAGVEDVVQDAFVRAFGSLESFRGESAFRTWLFTIARRLVADLRRSRKRGREDTEVQEGDAATEFDALDDVIAGESQRRMQQALTRLTPTQREVFVLRVNDGMSYKEIADVVGTTEGAARVHYHNALRQMKETLNV